MFTFVTISYNQEKYIVEHLESVKYQIQYFGEGKAIFYILSDDASTDNTVVVAKKWLEKNQELFQGYRILTAETNQGVVQNYLKATQAVMTEKYKLLAGDDLYYVNNIFAALEDEDVIFTPVLSFRSQEIFPDQSIPYIMNDDKRMIKYKLSFHNLFHAPGAFFARKVFTDQSLIDFLSQYHWIEDLPTWYYLFNIKKELSFQVKDSPYILYRISEGLSNSKNNEKHTAFEIEEEHMYKNLNIKKRHKNNHIKPLYFMYYLIKAKYYLIDQKLNKNIKHYQQGSLSDLPKAENHLRYLASLNEQFLKTKDSR